MCVCHDEIILLFFGKMYFLALNGHCRAEDGMPV